MDFDSWLKEYRERVDKQLEEFARSEAADMPFLMQYLRRRGKRIRPMLCLAAYECLPKKRQSGNIDHASIALELMHASTLCHDDIMDEDMQRRNAPSLHALFQQEFLRSSKERQYSGSIFGKESMKYAVSAAMIGGNLLTALAFDVLMASGFEDARVRTAMTALSRAYQKINIGQLEDISFQYKDSSKEEYLSMAEKKTGALIQASLETGCILSGAPEKICKGLACFGLNIAIAFQIRDDLLDCEQGKGNTFGSDIRKGKKTILMIYALQKASAEERSRISASFGKPDAAEAEIKRIIALYEKTSSVKVCQELAREYLEKGMRSLSNIKQDIEKDHYAFFSGLARYIVERKV